MRGNKKTYLQQVIKKTAGQYILDFNLSWKQKRESYSLRFYFSWSIFVSVILSHLFEVGLGRKRTCERRCRRRKSRRTSPVHRAEAEWGSAPGCSSPDPAPSHNCHPTVSREQQTIISLRIEKKKVCNWPTLWGSPVLLHHTGSDRCESDAAKLEGRAEVNTLQCQDVQSGRWR